MVVDGRAGDWADYFNFFQPWYLSEENLNRVSHLRFYWCNGGKEKR